MKFYKVCHYSLIVVYYVGMSGIPKYIITNTIFDGVLDLDKRKLDFFSPEIDNGRLKDIWAKEGNVPTNLSGCVMLLHDIIGFVGASATHTSADV